MRSSTKTTARRAGSGGWSPRTHGWGSQPIRPASVSMDPAPCFHSRGPASSTRADTRAEASAAGGQVEAPKGDLKRPVVRPRGRGAELRLKGQKALLAPAGGRRGAGGGAHPGTGG